MSDILPQSGDVYAWPPVPQSADVYLVDDVEPPLFTRHMLFVIADDFPMTELLNSINAIPHDPSPGPNSHTALLPRTPNLMALAASGVRLRSCRVQVECSPTRATCLTGVYPFRHGIANVVNLNATQSGDLYEFGDPGFVFPTLFNKLAAEGVRTSFVGKIHLSADYNQTFNGRGGSGWAILDRVVAGDTHTATTLRNLNQTSGDLITNGNQGSYYKYALNLTRSNHSEFLVDSVADGDAAFNTTRLVDEAIAFWNTVDNSQRAFQWLAVNATHTPLGGAHPETKKDFPPDALVATQEYKDLRDDEADGGALVSFWEDQQAHAEAVDAEVFGRLLASIPSEVRQSLTVVFIGDNGHDTISIPAARNVWGKDFGDDWNFVIDNNRMKGTPYHHGSRVEALWAGPGLGGPTMLRAGQVLDFAVDAPDIPETIARYFGTTMAPTDGVSFYEALYTDPSITYKTHARQFQYTETFNPNGDWNDLMAGPAAGQELRQAMWGWYHTAQGSAPAGRYHLIRTRVSGAWTYELFHHYDANHAAVDPYEKTNIAGDATYATIKADLEARIDALLSSTLGGGNAIAFDVGGVTKFMRTETVEGEERIPLDGTGKHFTTSGTGLPLEGPGKEFPYVSVEEQANWQLRLDIATLGPFDKFFLLDSEDRLSLEGTGKSFASTPGSPNTIALDGTGKVFELEAV